MTLVIDAPSESSPAFWRRFARAALWLAVVWFGLNGADLRSWLIGLPAVVGAAVLVARSPRGRPLNLRWAGLPPFGLFFVRKSVIGGWDVARRVLGFRLRIAPGTVFFETSLPPGPARVLFLNVISLLPGTLTAAVDGDAVTVHTLDVHADLEPELRELERRVAGLFAGLGGFAS
jgi:multicomponent Na+:H+ antiporter subunit E